MDGRLFLKAAAVQLAAVGAIFLALLIAPLPHHFFEDWGAIVGPAGWIAGSLVTGRVLGLSLGRTAAAAAVGGALSGVSAVAGTHSAGLVLGIVGFAAVAALHARSPLPSS